jgi:uncharacterized cysteine cluster protein YcgN (CxxCxxCC family)
MTKNQFWREKSLAEMSQEEWESLCDGCGKCCLLKLENADTGRIDFTEISCRLLDVRTCRCSRYARRKRNVPDCVVLDAATVGSLGFMPSTCAYRLVAEGRDLPWWHHLISGSRETVHLAGASVRDRVISETAIDEEDYQDYIVDWPR